MKGKHLDKTAALQALQEWEDACAISGFFFFGITLIGMFLFRHLTLLPLILTAVMYSGCRVCHVRKKAMIKNCKVIF